MCFIAFHEIRDSIAARQADENSNLNIYQFHRMRRKFKMYYTYYVDQIFFQFHNKINIKDNKY